MYVHNALLQVLLSQSPAPTSTTDTAAPASDAPPATTEGSDTATGAVPAEDAAADGLTGAETMAVPAEDAAADGTTGGGTTGAPATDALTDTPPGPTLEQAPAQPTTGVEVPVAPPEGIPPATLVAYGVIGLVLLFLLVRVVKALRKQPELPTTPGAKAPEALPEELPVQRIELPPSEEERALVAKEEAAQEKVRALRRERQELEAALKTQRQAKDAAAITETESRLEALKGQEREAGKEAYAAEKAAEDAAKARRREERQEEERLRQEAAATVARREEEARQAVEAAERAKVQAEAGRTLSAGLDRTRNQGFMSRLNGLFSGSREVDESVLAELEEILFTADIGVRTASDLVEKAREKAKRGELTTDRMKDVIREEIAAIVDLPKRPTLEGGGPPHVLMVVGVNGAGKTTTIGKLAAKLKADGKKVVLAAADTFRAAAAEQLEVWAERSEATLVRGAEGADPGSVAFEAVKRGVAEGADVIICDTAGRLHTKAPLMEELRKVHRVMGKALPGAPHEVLLVLDATMGQNAIQQARQFNDAVPLTSIALTKLDGTAKGGVVIGICDELKLPVTWIGVGEQVPDLRRFEPREFVAALFE